MFLLLYRELDKNERDWLTRNTLAVAPLAWVHRAHVKGTLAVRLDQSALEDLKGPIDIASANIILWVEDKIKENSLRGRSKQLAIDRLKLVVEACMSLDLINHAKDILAVLGEDYKSDSIPDRITKDDALGVDHDAVREYILRLAKKPSIH